MSRARGETPPGVPTLGPLRDGLVVAAAGGPGRILLEGRRTCVVADRRGPVDSVRIEGRPVCGAVRAASGTVANIAVAPGVARREWIGPEGPLLETVLASRGQPLVALQWTGLRAPREISVVLPAVALGPGVRTGPSRVDVPDADRVVALAVHPTPESLALTHAEGAPLLLLRPADGREVTLLLAAGPTHTVDAVLGTAHSLAVQLRLAQRGPDDDGLRVITGVESIDDAVAWARLRLDGALRRASSAPVPPPPPRLLWATLAATAGGDREAAGHGVGAMLAVDANADDVADGAFAAAAAARSFGDPRAALQSARALLSAGPQHPRASAARALVEALHGAAPPELADRLRILAETSSERARVPAVGRARRLPVVGHPSAGNGRALWLTSLLDGDPDPSPGSGWSELEREICAFVGGFRSDPEAAWTAWRVRAETGLEGGPFGPGTWDAPDGPGDASRGILLPRTAALLLALARGLLGLAPDAHSGRLRIAPRLSGHLLRFRVDGMSAGSTRVALQYERDSRAHAFVLEPTTAAIPPTVVFEPSVPGRVREVRIDEDPAELDVRTEGERSVVPIQLPLDGVRRVEIRTG